MKVSAERVHSMAMRLDSPRFMLHDLRKMMATAGEKLGLGNELVHSQHSLCPRGPLKPRIIKTHEQT
jgi:hypothetical protein